MKITISSTKTLSSCIKICMVAMLVLRPTVARLNTPRVLSEQGELDTYIFMLEPTIGMMSTEDVGSRADDFVINTSGTTGLVFAGITPGFTINNITESEAMAFAKSAGVLTVDKDEIVTTHMFIDHGPVDSSREDAENYASIISQYNNIAGRKLPSNITASGTSSCPVAQTIPWGVERVGGYVNMEKSRKKAFILDTGVSNLPDFNINYNLAKSFLRDDNSWLDANGHGTHVAGVIAAKDDGCNVVGVAAGVKVVPVRVLDRNGNGYLSQVVAGISYVGQVGRRGDVANLSLGGPVRSTVMDVALKAVAEMGIKFTISAGNSGKHASTFSPARTEGTGIFTISAVGKTDRMAWFSNYGNPPIDYAAPGMKIKSLWMDGSLREISGTSMASPHVAGLLLSGSMDSDGTATNDPDGTDDTPIAYRLID